MASRDTTGGNQLPQLTSTLDCDTIFLRLTFKISGEVFMNKLKEAALDYAEQGWPIFPCRADKTPYVKHGVLEATTNLDTIEEWWDEWPRANIALDVAGAGMMVIDLDPGHDIEELKKNVGGLPDTNLEASTPRGGRHLFYSIGEKEIISPSASKLAPHVDVRSFNSYVLLFPSKTADGSYKWTGEGKPHFRTDEMVRLCNTGRDKHKDRDEWIIEPDLQDNVALAIEWLKTSAKIAIEGQGGDNMAYATAAHMKSFGISKELAFDLIWDHWNPRCVPPWGADEAEHLETKIENGYQYNTSPPGNVTPGYKAAKSAAMFKPVVKKVGEEGHEWTAGRFRAVDRQGMKGIAPPSWLIKDFIPSEGHVLMVGAPGTFKTFLAIDIAMSIATGCGFDKTTRWPDVMESGPVLFAAGEGRSNFTSRIRAWEKTHFFGQEVNNFRLMDPVPNITEDLDAFIECALQASPKGYALTVIDTVGRAMQGANENAQEHASAFTAMVQAIQYSLGGAVLCLHHTKKDDKTSYRGSGVFEGDADTLINVERPGKEELVSLTMGKQKDAPEWEKPRFVKLTEVKLSLDPPIKSLVAMMPKKDEKPAKKIIVTDKGKDVSLDIIEEAALDFLRSNKLKEYSNNALAEAVATDPRIGIASQQLGKTWLKRLREDNETALARCWFRSKGRWRYSE
ncbi:MAG: bifunctional DNA primase/polymerase [Nitrospinaceae bacterium]|nr:bifunctional DNA primase/polymerase [Nitrospinaceae bacterium]